MLYHLTNLPDGEIIAQKLFFGFFVRSVFLAPFAKLLELDFALNFLFIFPRIIIGSFTSLTIQFY